MAFAVRMAARLHTAPVPGDTMTLARCLLPRSSFVPTGASKGRDLRRRRRFRAGPMALVRGFTGNFRGCVGESSARPCVVDLDEIAIFILGYQGVAGEEVCIR